MDLSEYDKVPVERWERLWVAVKPNADRHPIDLATLGEYAVLARRRGESAAARAFPSVAAHLRLSCPPCREDLIELAALADEELQEELVPLGLRLLGGFLVPLPTRFRGSAIERADRLGADQEAASPLGRTELDPPADLASSFDLFQRAIDEQDPAARDAVATRFRRIVSAWIRRDPSWKPIDGNVDNLTTQTFDRFWSTVDREQFAEFRDLFQVLGRLKETAEATRK